MLLSRPPIALLEPFVEALWFSDESTRGAQAGTDRERILPTDGMRLVFRLSGAPLRVFTGHDDDGGRDVGSQIVGGLRLASYIREISKPMVAVGARLRPGAAPALFGVPANELTGRHTLLEDLWGGEAALLRDRLGEAASPARRIDLLEEALVRKLLESRQALPRFVPFATSGLVAGLDVGSVVKASGYSHRHFNALFLASVGLTPKQYSRLIRFQTAVRLLTSTSGSVSLTQVAMACGYADQAHLTREFLAFSGMTPVAYMRTAPSWAHHVPLVGQISSRRDNAESAKMRDEEVARDKDHPTAPDRGEKRPG